MDQLISQTLEGKPLVLFVGSGISINTGIPTGGKLKDQMEEELEAKGYTNVRGKSYSELMELAYPSTADRRTFFDSLCLGKKPTDEHYLIAEFVRAGFVRAVITTNFDHLLEHAFLGVCGRIPPTLLLGTVNHQLFSNICQPVLAKVHGDFLYENLVNLPAEICEQIISDESDLIRDLCSKANILVVGYGGLDQNIMANLAATLSDNDPDRGKIWWSEYSRDPLTSPSEFQKMVQSGERANNPVIRLGPWPAAKCLEKVAAGLDVAPIKRFPFGIAHHRGICDTPHIQGFQEYAGKRQQRSLALKMIESELIDCPLLIIRASVENAYQLSLALSAIAESMAPGSLYFNPRFAPGPSHFSLKDSLIHHVKLSSDINSESPLIIDEFSMRDGVLVLDQLESEQQLRDSVEPGIDFNTLNLIKQHYGSLRAIGKGKIIIGTTLTLEQLEDNGLIDDAEIIDVDERLANFPCLHEASGDLEEVESGFLDVLAVSIRSVPIAVTLSISGCSKTVLNNPEIEKRIDRRGFSVALRPGICGTIASRISKSRVQQLAIDLAEELVKLAHSTPFNVSGELILSAETLLFSNDADSKKALELLVPLDIETSTNLSFIRPIVMDYAKLILEEPNKWARTPITVTMGFVNKMAAIAREQLLEENQLGARELLFLMDGVIDILTRGHPVEVLQQIDLDNHQLFGTWIEDDPKVYKTNSEAQFSPTFTQDDEEVDFRREIHSQIFIYRNALKSFSKLDEESISFIFYAGHRVSSLYHMYFEYVARQLGYKEIAYPVPEEIRPILINWLHWVERMVSFLEPHASRTEFCDRFGKARDNLYLPLKLLRPLYQLTETLLDFVGEASRSKGFTARKAVNYGNYALHLLEQGKYSEAEPWFHEAIFHGMMMQGIESTMINLEGLARYFRKILFNIQRCSEQLNSS